MTIHAGILAARIDKLFMYQLLHSCALGVKHNIFTIVLLVELNPSSSYEKRRYVPRTLTRRPVASRNRVVRPNNRISTRSEAQELRRKRAKQANICYNYPQFAALLQQALKARDTASFLLNESLGTHCSLVNVACLLPWERCLDIPDRLLRLCIHCMLGSTVGHRKKWTGQSTEPDGLHVYGPPGGGSM